MSAVKQRAYEEVISKLEALLAGEDDMITRMATIACELYGSLDHADWVGFYRNMGNQTLKVGPYQGSHGCLTIPFSSGVCGKCAREQVIQNVPDVSQMPCHIACSCTTRSEIVLPVLNAKGELIAVLDIDSDSPAAFDATDERNLHTICERLARA